MDYFVNQQKIGQKDQYINLLHDWGFKYIFKSESRKDLLIKFLNCLLEEKEFGGSIVEVEYIDTDIQSADSDGRNSSLDLICKDKDENIYMIEVQCGYQSYFRARAMFYVSQIIVKSGMKGDWDYDIKGIYSINIVNYPFGDDPKFRTDYDISDTLDRDRKLINTRIIFLQVPRLSDTFEDCKSLTEKWVWGLKNISSMENKNLSQLKEEFKRIISLANVASMSESERMYYEADVKRLRDTINQIESARVLGMEAGLEKGREEEKRTIAISLKSLGIDTKIISQSTGLSEEIIRQL